MTRTGTLIKTDYSHPSSLYIVKVRFCKVTVKFCTVGRGTNVDDRTIVYNDTFTVFYIVSYKTVVYLLIQNFPTDLDIIENSLVLH